MAIAGKNTIGATEDFDAADDGDVQGPYTVGAGATITEFHAYLRATDNGTDQKFRPLIYADNAGEPGALIATLPEISFSTFSTTGAWRDLTGLSVSVGSATAIWIGLWFFNVGHHYVYDTPGGNPSRYKGAIATYSSTGDCVDPWPAASDTPATQEKSLYVVYTAGGGTNATVTAVAAAATASVVAPPKPRPTPPFAEVNLRM